MRRHNQFLQFSPNISVKTSSTISPDDSISSFCIILYWLWPLLFNIPMNLHCSQTGISRADVSVSFNIPMNLHCSQTRITEHNYHPSFNIPMNLHCSQTDSTVNTRCGSLISLWIYIALKLYQCSTSVKFRLISLWIYIALKL